MSGALVSVGLLLYAGRDHHPGATLVAIFIVWVLSPFVLLAVVGRPFRQSSAVQRVITTLSALVAVADVCVYAIATIAAHTVRIVPVFVLTPPISSAAIVIVISAAFASAKRKRNLPG